MSFQYNINKLITDRLNEISTDVGTSPYFVLFTGAEPAHCATPSSGTQLNSDQLPSTWMASAAAGTASKTGTWTLNGTTGGTAGYFRIYDSGSATCYIQGSVTITGGGGDLTMDNNIVANGQVITVNTFTITGGNA